jgi:hypothetical protein
MQHATITLDHLTVLVNPDFLEMELHAQVRRFAWTCNNYLYSE